jgi:hypothetical protein
VTSDQSARDKRQRNFPVRVFLQVKALPLAALPCWFSAEQRDPRLKRWAEAVGIALGVGVAQLDGAALAAAAVPATLPALWAGLAGLAALEAATFTVWGAIAGSNAPAVAAAVSELPQPLTLSAKATITGATMTRAPTN